MTKPSTARERGRWDTFWAELTDWVTEHGTANVAQKTTTRDGTYALGREVKYYRGVHAKGRLPADRATALEQLPGWTWNASHTRWEDNLATVQAHLQAGNTLSSLPAVLKNWLNRQPDNPELTPTQRRQIKALTTAAAGEDPLTTFVRHATRWAQQHGDITDLRHVDVITVDGQPYPLGRKRTYYRSRAHLLDPDQTRALEQIPGWTWGPLPSKRRNRQPAQ